MGTARAFYFEIANISIFSGALHILERGVLFYLIVHAIVFRPVYLYVLEHECVHVLATWLCGGTIVSFSVTPSGGNVVTSKTNFFIELSPYFVPLYTILIGVAFYFMNMAGNGNPKLSAIFVFFVGATLAFHFAMTAEALKLQQPDIVKSGIVFSFIVIFVCNLIVVMAFFCPIFENLSFVAFLKSAAANTEGFYRIAYAKAMTFANAHNIL